MRVRGLLRSPHPGQKSLERIWDNLQRGYPADVQTETWTCPVPTSGLGSLRKNVRAVSRLKSTGLVNHIVADVHFLVLGLDPARTLLTIADMVNLHRLTGPRRFAFEMLYYSLPMRRARIISTISPFTKQELLARYPWAARKTIAVPIPVEPSFRFAPVPDNPKPVLLQVGTRSNKNLEGLLKAVRGMDVRVVAVGALTDAQRTAVKESGVEFESLVNVDDDVLQAAYARADVCFFASTYEGFGLPIVEAQVVGTPVVTSSLSPMDLVSGGAAELVNPHDPEDIRAGIRRILEDPAHRDDLIARGRENADLYTASSVAAQYVSLYQLLEPGLNGPIDPTDRWPRAKPI